MFQILGVILTSDLSWSSHVESICTKSQKLLGLLYCRFYKHAEPSALLQLYRSLIRPYLVYASDVWDSHLDIELIGNVQRFGLRICSKQWDLGYDELLSNFSVPNLQSHRLHHKRCTMFKIVHCLISFPSSVFVPHPSRCRSNVYIQPFAPPTVFCTHSYLVLFLLGIHCQLMLLMHLLYLHLKHCIHALKFCKYGTSLY